MAKRKLTGKQRAFIVEYPKDFNQTKAAERAGYSVKSARQTGTDNMKNPSILEAIELEYKKRAISADEIIHRLLSMAKGETPAKITKKSGGETIKVYDPKGALELLGKYHALFTERIRIDDWRFEFIELIREGELEYSDVREELGKDLATELFDSAGINVSQARKAEAQSTE